jgi:hypothetical protein
MRPSVMERTIAANLASSSLVEPHAFGDHTRYYLEGVVPNEFNCYIQVSRQGNIEDGIHHCFQCVGVFGNMMPMDTFLQRDRFIRTVGEAKVCGSCPICYKTTYRITSVCMVCTRCTRQHAQEKQWLVDIWLLCREFMYKDLVQLVVSRIIRRMG